jgi:hypothetical protein
MIEQAGRIAKMRVEHLDTVQYYLPLDEGELHLNPHLGKAITLTSSGAIYCMYCNRAIKKSFNQGFCYPCFQKLARCDQCIMKPELCHYDKGTCREPSWGETNCMIPHIVYLANSSGLKVGITRHTQVPTRWIDQGAIQALPIFKVKKRLDCGIIEVALKAHIADKTNWRKMLKNDVESVDMHAARDQLFSMASDEIDLALDHVDDADICTHADVYEFNYPVLTYPEKVTSLSFDKADVVEGVLKGIKGQYLILDTGVINMRKFTGYHVSVRIEE